MNRELLERARQALTERKEGLMEWFSGASFSRRREALGEPAQPDRGEGPVNGEDLSLPPVVYEVEAALHQVDAESLGRCVVCNEEVEPEMLELDFATCVCLTHYSEAQQRELEKDLELAARVQQHLFPSYTPALPGVQIAAHTAPARIVSGDYYDFFPQSDHCQGLAIGDVMGKGISASMLMANLQASLRILGPMHPELDALAAHLNRLFVHNLRLIRFISLFLMTLDTERRRIRYCNAGHNPGLFWTAETGACCWLAPTGPAIGLMSDAPFQVSEHSYESGDILVLYTDGVAEARSLDGRQFGRDGIADFIGERASGSAESLLAGLWTRLGEHANGEKHDDATLMVVKFE